MYAYKHSTTAYNTFTILYTGVDITEATKAKIKVSKIPSDECGNAASCAEHAIYLAISVLRNQYNMNQSIINGRIGVPSGRTLLKSNIMIYGKIYCML